MYNYQNKTKKELIEELEALKLEVGNKKGKELSPKTNALRNKKVTENSIFAVIIYYEQTKSICYVNEEAEKLTGYKQNELIALKIEEIITDEYLKQIKENCFSKKNKNKTPARIEIKIIKKQGKEKWINFSASRIVYGGEPAIMGTAFDITEKKEAELHIYESEIRFRSLYENAPMPYVSLDQKGVIISANNAFIKELGFNKTEINNHWLGEFISQKEIKKLDLIINAIIQKGQISDYLLTLRTRKGEKITYSIVGNTFYDIRQMQSRIQIILYNITIQIEAQKALRISEEKYKRLVSKLPDLVLVHIKGKIVFANDTTISTLGYSVGEIINTSVFDYLDDENQKIVLYNMSKRQKYNETMPVYEVSIRTKFNTYRTCEVRASLIQYEGKKASLVVITDITDRKRMEESLYESQRLIFTLMSNLPGMAYRCMNDPNWTMEFVSDGCKELTEYDPFDLIDNNKLSFRKFIHPEDVLKDHDIIRQALETKTPFQTIYRIITASGKIKWVWEKGRGVYNDKELLFIEGFITDITQLKNTELDLKLSKERFSIMAENIQDGLTIISDDKLIYMNQRAEEIFGIEDKELLLLNNDENKDEAIKEKIQKIISDLNIQGKGPEFLEYWININENEKKFIRNSYSSVEISPDKNVYYVITADLTERKNKEDEIKNNEKKLRSLLDDAPLGIVYADLSGNIEYVNPEMVQILGSPSIEATKSLNLLTFPILIKYGVSSKVAECIKMCKKISYETYYQSKWGKEVYISLKLSPLLNYKGAQIGLMILADDITEQKKAESLLKISEQKNRAMIDAIPDIMFRLTADGVFVDYKTNDLEKLLVPPEDFIGKSVFHVLPRKLAKTIMLNIKNAIQTGEVQQFDYDLFFNDQVNYYELRLIKSGEEEVFAIIRDITENKIAEKEIEQLNLELIEKNKEQEQLIFVSSHDLRSPLVNIQGFSKELHKTFEYIKSAVHQEEDIHLLREQLSKVFEIDIPDSFNFIFNSTNKMDMLIAGLLKISRLGKTALNKREIDMNQLMKLVLSIFEYQIKEKNILITVEDLPSCIGDEMMINQIFSNLIDNAIKYFSPERIGSITITGHLEDDNTVYCVKDNGIGIRNTYFNKIFELFHQLDITKQGEGLGLAITKKIVEKHNGKIWVISEENMGSSFFVSLPHKIKE